LSILHGRLQKRASIRCDPRSFKIASCLYAKNYGCI
jgi:hypothetical protein